MVERRRGGCRRSPSSGRSSTSASRRSSTGRPATAAASTSAVAGGRDGRPAPAGPRSTERGSSASPAANSSSTNSGLPSERRQMRSDHAGRRVPPAIRRSWRSTASRSSRPSSSTTVDVEPLELREPGEDRVPAGQVVNAAGQDDRHRSVVRLRDRKVSRSRVARSIQWTSSMTSTAGPALPTARRTGRACARTGEPVRGPMGAWPGPGQRRCVAGPSPASSGAIAARSPRAGPEQPLQRLRRYGAGEPAQGRCDGEIGKPTGPDVKTLAGEDQRSLRTCCVRGLLREAGLADPCLAAYDDEPWGARRACVDLPNQGGDVAITTDKLRARGAGGHGDHGTAVLKVPSHEWPLARAVGAAPAGTAPWSSSGYTGAAPCTAPVGDHRAMRVPFGPPEPPKRE